MKKAEEIQDFVKDCFKLYGLDYLEYFGRFSGEEDKRVEIPFETDGQVNMDMVMLAGQALGMSAENVLAMDETAADQWYDKYTFFGHIHQLNIRYKQSFFAEGAVPLWLIDFIPNANLYNEESSRYSYLDVKNRLVQQLQKINESLPGTFHAGASIQNLKITTSNFCSYEGTEDMVGSYIQMVERAKYLFQKALCGELMEEEINEYNILVSALGIRDKACAPKGYLYYKSLRNCAEVYKEEGLHDFFEIVNFHSHNFFAPWICKEFACNKDLVQAFVNIIPEAKREMREYAMRVLQFRCCFVWSDAKPIQFEPWEEEELREAERVMELTDIPRAKEPTLVYVPKTDAELNGDRKVAETLIKLCGAETCGGVTLPSHRNATTCDVRRMARRLGRLLPHNYEKWLNDMRSRKCRMPPSTTETGGSTNE